jgi:hypothetical protein
MTGAGMSLGVELLFEPLAKLPVFRGQVGVSLEKSGLESANRSKQPQMLEVRNYRRL